MMEEKIAKKLAEEDLLKISGGENLDVSKYSEEELAKIFDLYFEMYGYTGVLPYLSSWGVTAGDYFLMTHKKYWSAHPVMMGRMAAEWRIWSTSGITVDCLNPLITETCEGSETENCF